jgi:hypothetical protein
MKFRKFLFLTLALLLIGGTAVFADSVTQKVRVFMNKHELDDGGIVVDGKSYISVRSIGDALQALVTWDDSTKKLKIVKPNVHMLLIADGKYFGNVDKRKLKFSVFSQIDNLTTDISAFKVTITDPYDDETWIDGRSDKDDDFVSFQNKDNFWFGTQYVTYNFDTAGKYKVRFWMKQDDGPMQLVSEKVITCN